MRRLKKGVEDMVKEEGGLEDEKVKEGGGGKG